MSDFDDFDDPHPRKRLRHFGRSLLALGVSSLTRRIVVLNLAGLVTLLSGMLYLNQFRAGLIDARVQSLLIQGEIIAGAIAASAAADNTTMWVDPRRLLDLPAGESVVPNDDSLQSLDFPINPERVAPILRRLVTPTRTQARIYDREGQLLLDSRSLYARGDILRFDLPPPQQQPRGIIEKSFGAVKGWLLDPGLPVYEELGSSNGKNYPEVVRALQGSAATQVRTNSQGEMIVFVAVPIQRFRAVTGTLLLSTQGGDIDAIVWAERVAIVRVFIVAAIVMVVMSLMLASTIAAPLRRLALAAERARTHINKGRSEMPDFGNRSDEIGHLSRALRDMTEALYRRIEAIESFAADVSHELKNPLTSLRSAVETMPLAKKAEAKERLLGVIQHDVQRLDRLITDIADASRLDAELQRQNVDNVDLATLLNGIVDAQNDMRRDDGVTIALNISETARTRQALTVKGHDLRLGQVMTNLIENARSFSPKGGTVTVACRRVRGDVEITVDDEGCGIRDDALERIFERFYTDRPEHGFGQNSGLGLSISKQIVEVHNGRIKAENRYGDADEDGQATVLGARFTLWLPAAQ
jgi:two-component system, OmpR family, sensor histidine kinase ChvG